MSFKVIDVNIPKKPVTKFKHRRKKGFQLAFEDCLGWRYKVTASSGSTRSRTGNVCTYLQSFSH